MLQECGSATTRYCRNAPRVGKERLGLSCLHHPQHPARGCLHSLSRQGFPATSTGIPSATLGQAVGDLAIRVQRAAFDTSSIAAGPGNG